MAERQAGEQGRAPLSILLTAGQRGDSPQFRRHAVECGINLRKQHRGVATGLTANACGIMSP